jgi:hypothetical protein
LNLYLEYLEWIQGGKETPRFTNSEKMDMRAFKLKDMFSKFPTEEMMEEDK